MTDYVLIVVLFFIGQAVAYYLGRRDERNTIKIFCDDIGLSDLMYQVTQDYMKYQNENDKENEEK